MKTDYQVKATLYCEQYGIIQYRVKGNLLIYNVSYPAYLNQPHYTIQHTINLDTMQHTSKQLARYDAKGAYNRH